MKYWWSFIFLFGVIFYFPSLFYGFSQDDFIHLSASQAHTIPEFLNFFNPIHQYPDIFFFRPLSTQLYFFLNTSFFGLNSIPFHIESLTFHILNGILFYLLTFKLFKEKKIAVLSASFYVISAIHFLSLFYISAFQQILRTFFIFGSILLYLNFLEKKEKKYLIGSVLGYLAALLSKETSLILPLIFPLILSIKNKQSLIKELKENLKTLIPFLIILICYLIIRVFGIQTIFNQGSYELSFSLGNALQNLKWYIIWIFGLPEILATYPSLGPNSLVQFTKDFSEAIFILISLVLFILTLGFPFLKPIQNLTLNNFMHVRNFVKDQNWVAYFLLFFIPLLPVLFLEGHKYPQYLDLSLISFLPLLSILISKNFSLNKAVAVISIGSFLLLQFFSLRLTEQTHWTTHRSEISEHYQKAITQKYNNLPENSSVALIGNQKALDEVSHALAGKYAFQVWYPGKIKDVNYLESENEIKDRENLIIHYIDKY